MAEPRDSSLENCGFSGRLGTQSPFTGHLDGAEACPGDTSSEKKRRETSTRARERRHENPGEEPTGIVGPGGQGDAVRVGDGEIGEHLGVHRNFDANAGGACVEPESGRRRTFVRLV